jgi:hypothetical protein
VRPWQIFSRHGDLAEWTGRQPPAAAFASAARLFHGVHIFFFADERSGLMPVRPLSLLTAKCVVTPGMLINNRAAKNIVAQSRRITMGKILVSAIAAAVAAGALASAATTGYAAEQPWCVIYGGAQGDFTNCQMRTFDECRQEMIAGNRGSCFPNPWYRPNGTSFSGHSGRN